MELKTIKLANLCVSTTNPRFEQQFSQKEAMARILEDQKDKLVVLASDILEHGLNPLDMILVTPSDGVRYDVLEGNRRVTALKFMANPLLIDESYISIRKRFIKLVEGKDISLFKNIQCVVEDDDIKANLWIKRKHAGELGGMGTVSWTALQIQRFDANIDGKTSDALQIINYLIDSKYATDDFKNKLSRINTTNLSRLISDPDVRVCLGIYKENGHIHSTVAPQFLTNNLVTLVEGIMSPGFTVKQIYNKSKRKEYIKSLNIEAQENDESVDTWPLNNPSTDISSNPIQTTATRSRISRNNERASLIPSKFNISIDNPRICQIFNELKHTSMRQSPNAVAVLFRVFLELTVDSFIDENSLNVNGFQTASEEQNLIGKCSRVIQHIRTHKLLPNNKLSGIQHAIKDKNSICSIDTLNDYVHNMHFSPKEDNLRIGWDNVQPFFEVVWNNMTPRKD